MGWWRKATTWCTWGHLGPDLDDDGHLDPFKLRGRVGVCKRTMFLGIILSTEAADEAGLDLRLSDVAHLEQHHSRPVYARVMGRKNSQPWKDRGYKGYEHYEHYEKDPRLWRGAWALSPRGGSQAPPRYDQVRLDGKNQPEQAWKEQYPWRQPSQPAKGLEAMTAMQAVQRALTATRKADQKIRKLQEDKERRQLQWDQFAKEQAANFVKQKRQFADDMTRLDTELLQAAEAGNAAAERVKAIVLHGHVEPKPMEGQESEEEWDKLIKTPSALDYSGTAFYNANASDDDPAGAAAPPSADKGSPLLADRLAARREERPDDTGQRPDAQIIEEEAEELDLSREPLLTHQQRDSLAGPEVFETWGSHTGQFPFGECFAVTSLAHAQATDVRPDGWLAHSSETDSATLRRFHVLEVLALLTAVLPQIPVMGPIYAAFTQSIVTLRDLDEQAKFQEITNWIVFVAQQPSTVLPPELTFIELLHGPIPQPQDHAFTIPAPGDENLLRQSGQIYQGIVAAVGQCLRFLAVQRGHYAQSAFLNHLQQRIPVGHAHALADFPDMQQPIVVTEDTILQPILLQGNTHDATLAPRSTPTSASSRQDSQGDLQLITSLQAPRLLGVGPGRLTTDSDDEISSTDIAQARFLVLRLDCQPVELTVSFQTPSTVEQVIETVAQALPDEVYNHYSQVHPVDPQPSSQWGLALALPSWASQEPLIVCDTTAVDGRLFLLSVGPVTARQRLCRLAGVQPQKVTIYAYGSAHPLTDGIDLHLEPYRCVFFVPQGSPPKVGHSLKSMAITPYGWFPAVHLPLAPGGQSSNIYCLATAGGDRLHRLQATRDSLVPREIAESLGLPTGSTVVQPGVPRIADASYQGYHCRNVLAVARLPEDEDDFRGLAPALALVDCRALLQGWQVLFVYNGKVSHSDLACQLAHFAPAEHHVQLDGTRMDGEDLLVDPGQVVIAQYVASTPAPAGEDEESECSSDPAVSDTSTMGMDTTTAPADSEGEHLFADDPAFASGASRSRSRTPPGRVRSSTTATPQDPVPTAPPPPAAGETSSSQRSYEPATGSMTAPTLAGIVIAGTLPGASATPAQLMPSAELPVQLTALHICILFGIFVALVAFKVLIEPALQTPPSQLALATLRMLAHRAGLSWRYSPSPTSLFLPEDHTSDSDGSSHVEDIPLRFVVATPGYTLERIMLRQELPTTVPALIPSLQTARDSARSRVFSTLIPADPQPCAGTGLFLAVPDRPTTDCVLCIDTTLFDQRLFAVKAPCYVDRRLLFTLANISPELHIQVYVGSDTHPLSDDSHCHVFTGQTVSFIPSDVRIAQPQSLHQALQYRAPWSRASTVPLDTESQCYCLATSEATHVFLYDTRAPQAYRRQVADTLRKDPATFRLFPASPRITDAAWDGLQCRTVIAICDKGPYDQDSHTGALVDARALLQGWRSVIIKQGKVSCKTIKAMLEPACPAGWYLRLIGIPDDRDLHPVHEGQVIVVSCHPCGPGPQAASHTGDRPLASGDASGPPPPTPASGEADTAHRPATHHPDAVRHHDTQELPPATSSAPADSAATAAEYLQSVFLIIGQDYCPEIVFARLPVDISVSAALTAVNSARAPYARLRLPRIIAVHPQSVPGVAVAIASPIWHPTGVLLLFDCSRVNGAIYTLQMPRILHRHAILTAAGIPTGPEYEVYVKDLPWPLPNGSNIELHSGDALVIVPVQPSVLVTMSLSDMLHSRTGWDQDWAPNFAEYTETAWILADHDNLLFQVASARRSSVRADLAQHLGLPPTELVLRPATPAIQNHAHRGIPTRNVLIEASPYGQPFTQDPDISDAQPVSFGSAKAQSTCLSLSREHYEAPALQAPPVISLAQAVPDWLDTDLRHVLKNQDISLELRTSFANLTSWYDAGSPKPSALHVYTDGSAASQQQDLQPCSWAFVVFAICQGECIDDALTGELLVEAPLVPPVSLQVCLPDWIPAFAAHTLRDWAWAMVPGHIDLPRPFAFAVEVALQQARPEPPARAPTQALVETRLPATDVSFCLTCLTFNVLTLKDSTGPQLTTGSVGMRMSGRKEVLKRSLREHRVHVVGLQETRLPSSELQSDPDYLIFNTAAAANGAGGCALWLSRKLAYGEDSTGRLIFQEDHVTVVSSSPRHLVANVLTPRLRLHIQVVHAPSPSNVSIGEVQDFWNSRASDFSKRPAGTDFLFLCDANSKVGSMPTSFVGSHQAEEENASGTLFHEFVMRIGALAPSTHAEYHQGSGGTWCSPRGLWSRLDYVLIPISWKDFEVHTKVLYEVEALQQRVDHVPLLCHCAFVKWAPAHTYTVNRRAALRPTLPVTVLERREVRATLASLAPQSWHQDSTSHHDALVEQWQQAIKPAQIEGPQPRQTFLSADTLSTIQVRTAARRYLAQEAQERDRRWRFICFAAFIHNCRGSYFTSQTLSVVESWLRQLDVSEARALTVLYASTKQIRRQVANDRQAHLASLAQQAAQHDIKDPAALYKALRKAFPETRPTRRSSFKPLPTLRLEDGTLATTHQERCEGWRRHFASQEAGSLVLPDEYCRLFEAAAPSQSWDMDIHAVPTLCQVEAIIHTLQCRKAAGADSITAETLKTDVPVTARQLLPLLAKTSLRALEPVSFRGGDLFLLAKRAANVLGCDGYRSILISSVLGKIYHRCVRQQLLPSFSADRAPFHAGILPGQGIELISITAKTFFHSCNARSQQGAIIFFDLKAAFYQVLRERLVEPADREARIEDLFAHLKLPDTAISELRQQLLNIPILAAAGVSAHTQALVRDMFRGTYFRLTKCSELTYTRRGSRPGDPAADLLFAFALSAYFRSALAALEAEGLAANIPHEATRPPFCPHQGPIDLHCPAWADDFLCPQTGQNYADLVNRARRAVQLLTEHASSLGMEVKFGTDKTAILLPAELLARHASLLDVDSEGALGLAFTDQITLIRHFVPAVHTYRHLGGILTSDSNPSPDLHYRFAQSMSTVKPLRRKLFGARRFDLKTRRMLLRSLAVSKYTHTAAALMLHFGVHRRLWERHYLTLWRVLTARTAVDVQASAYTVLRNAQATSPPLALAHARAACLAKLFRHGPADLIALLWDHWRIAPARSWLGQLCEDVQAVAVFQPIVKDLLGDSAVVPGILEAFAQDPTWWPRQVRSASQAFLQDLDKWHESKIAKAPRVPTPRAEDLPYQCHVCNSAFPLRKHMYAHMAKAHQIYSPARHYAISTVCQSCLKLFPDIVSAQLLGYELQHVWTLQRLANSGKALDHIFQGLRYLVHHFDQMLPQRIAPDVYCYGLAMDAWAEGGHWLQSLAIFDSIGSHTVPDAVCFGTAIRVCQKASDWLAACELLSDMASGGLKPDTVSFGAAMSACAAADAWGSALHLLATMSAEATEPDLICFNVAISACEMTGRWQTALALLEDLCKNFSPTATSFNAAITACGKGGEWQRALTLLSSMHDAAVLPDRISFNAAISACDNGGMWPAAVHLLFSMHGRMQAPDQVSFNAAISACEQGGAWHQALAVYQELILADLSPDELTHNAAVGSFAVASAWVAALHFLAEEMLSRGLCPNGLHAGAVARSAMASEGLEAAWSFLEQFKELWLVAFGGQVAEVPLNACLKSTGRPDAAEDVSLLASAPGVIFACKPAGLTTDEVVHASV
ncbi:unnamed protein product [Symbiodinium sp. CCMP2592]|nr:unnamed protein product [Symbiodinium sp. CCMP2592]